MRALAVIVTLVVVGRELLRWVFRAVARFGTREIFTAAALLAVIGAALLMHALGLSMSLGAFLAGVLLADSEFRHEIEAELEPFKGLLLGLFFIAVGMSVNLGLVGSRGCCSSASLPRSFSSSSPCSMSSGGWLAAAVIPPQPRHRARGGRRVRLRAVQPCSRLPHRRHRDGGNAGDGHHVVDDVRTGALSNERQAAQALGRAARGARVRPHR